MKAVRLHLVALLSSATWAVSAHAQDAAPQEPAAAQSAIPPSSGTQSIAAVGLATATPAVTAQAQGAVPPESATGQSATSTAGGRPNTAAAGSSGQVEDIVVTAQRRAELAQSVPIALQTFSRESLQRSGVTATEDLTTVVSGLFILQAGARPALFLRGVGNNSASTTPSVLTFIDGVYRPFGQSIDLVNIDRIEVLKGPQGTLFGRNATGGVIQITTRPPSETFGGRFEVGYGNFDTIQGTAYITGGLAPGVAMDASLRYDNQRGGFGTNIAIGQAAWGFERAMLRSRLRAELSDATTLTLAGDYSKLNIDAGTHFAPAFGYGFLFVDGALRHIGDSYFPGPYDVNSGSTVPRTRTHEWGVDLTLETSFSGLRARNITAYRRSSENQLIDSDAGPSDLVVVTANRTPRTSFTQELQLLSDDSGPFQWVTGLFYYRASNGSNPFQFSGSAPPGAGGTLSAFSTDRTDSGAAYAQASYHILEGTTLTLGGRYTIEKRALTGFVERNGVEIPGRRGTLSSKINEFSWRVALDHHFNRNMMVYASASRGFNSGFYNAASTGGFASEAQNPRVNPEFLTAYEVGEKMDLFDRRLRINLSAFRYDYEGLQQQIYELGVTKTINAAAARIQGIDFEVIARPIPSLTLSVTGAYLDATYKSYPLAPNYLLQPNGTIAATSNIDAAGRRIVNAPEWSYTLSATHVLPTSIGEFTTSATLNYRGNTFIDPGNRFPLPTRYLLNASERWTSSDGKFFASLWVNNLLNKRYDHSVAIVAPLGLVGLRASPRAYGVSAGFQF